MVAQTRSPLTASSPHLCDFRLIAGAELPCFFVCFLRLPAFACSFLFLGFFTMFPLLFVPFTAQFLLYDLFTGGGVMWRLHSVTGPRQSNLLFSTAFLIIFYRCLICIARRTNELPKVSTAGTTTHFTVTLYRSASSLLRLPFSSLLF